MLQGFHRLAEWFKEDQLYHLIETSLGKLRPLTITLAEVPKMKRDQFVQILKSHIQRDYLERYSGE